MPSPEQCQDMGEVRAEIDAIDREVVRLIGARARYVRAAARFKTSETSVRAPERFAAVLAARREWAVEEGLDPAVVERLYRDLVEHFIAEELREWRATDEPG